MNHLCRAGRIDELGREGLHPPVDRDVIDLDAAFGQQFLDVAVGQSVAQVPAHRDRDRLPREAVARRRRRGSLEVITRSVSLPEGPSSQTQTDPV